MMAWIAIAWENSAWKLTVTPAVDTSSQVDMGVDTPQFAADYSSIYLTLCHTLHVILEFLNIPIPKQYVELTNDISYT